MLFQVGGYICVVLGEVYTCVVLGEVYTCFVLGEVYTCDVLDEVYICVVLGEVYICVVLGEVYTGVVLGDVYTCVVLGEVYTWGDNDEGQLGDGTTNAIQRPRLVAALQGNLSPWGSPNMLIPHALTASDTAMIDSCSPVLLVYIIWYIWAWCRIIIRQIIVITLTLGTPESTRVPFMATTPEYARVQRHN